MSRELLLSARQGRSPSLRDWSRSSKRRQPPIRSTLEVSAACQIGKAQLANATHARLAYQAAALKFTRPSPLMARDLDKLIQTPTGPAGSIEAATRW